MEGASSSSSSISYGGSTRTGDSYNSGYSTMASKAAAAAAAAVSHQQQQQQQQQLRQHQQLQLRQRQQQVRLGLRLQQLLRQGWCTLSGMHTDWWACLRAIFLSFSIISVIYM
jgi:hypothetical protein